MLKVIVRGGKPAMRLLLAALLSCSLFAQDAPDMPSESPAAEPLPSSYRGVSLGMTLDEVKDALLADSIFGYRGDRDVSFIPGGDRQLIETAGVSFIRNAWFQFYDGKLYNMSFALDTSRLDYFSLFSSLSEKYGEPQELNPAAAVWLSNSVRLSLERPLTVKYIDSAVFASILETEYDSRANEEILRENFISDF